MRRLFSNVWGFFSLSLLIHIAIVFIVVHSAPDHWVEGSLSFYFSELISDLFPGIGYMFKNRSLWHVPPWLILTNGFLLFAIPIHLYIGALSSRVLSEYRTKKLNAIGPLKMSIYLSVFLIGWFVFYYAIYFFIPNHAPNFQGWSDSLSLRGMIDSFMIHAFGPFCFGQLFTYCMKRFLGEKNANV